MSEAPKLAVCENCASLIRRIYPGRRKQIDCWAHLSGSTLWCPSRLTLAAPASPDVGTVADSMVDCVHGDSNTGGQAESA